MTPRQVATPALRRSLRRRVRRGIRSGLEHAAGVRRQLPRPGTAVALTFDDGPDPEYTPQVLDVLAEHGVPATFFVLGRKAVAHPELVRRMVAQGCAVGSHSSTHPEAADLSFRSLREEYAGGAEALERILGARNRRFRPPKGIVDRTGVLAMRSARLAPWLWSIDPNDWHPATTVGDIVACGRSARPGDIFLLHDGIEAPISPQAADRSATVQALPDLIESLLARGITFRALP